MGTERDYTHIGMFDVDTCKKVIAVSNKYFGYRNYERGKEYADELQERINALKQALGEALINELRGDLNGDGVTDWDDFFILTSAWPARKVSPSPQGERGSSFCAEPNVTAQPTFA